MEMAEADEFQVDKAGPGFPETQKCPAPGIDEPTDNGTEELPIGDAEALPAPTATPAAASRACRSSTT